jgi:hypothetical protein
MKDPDLLDATGSEPLSLEEEVDMQQSWRDDETKCTFIVHAKELCHFSGKGDMEDAATNSFLEFRVKEHLDAMIGDVNLFLSEMDDDENDENKADKPEDPSQSLLLQAEIDIMIAEKEHRGKGLGRSATCAMMLYGASKLGICRFFCKINEDNEASISLFKSIGFRQCGYAACFKQVELELKRPLEEMEEIFKIHGGSYGAMHCPLLDGDKS